MNDDFRRRFIANIKRSVEPIARTVVLYRPGTELLPGVTTIAADGHTPGMSALLVHSGRDQLLVTADAAYDPLLNMENSWRPGPDLDPEAALRTRRHLFDRAAADRIPVLGFHFPFPGLGHVRTEGGSYGWLPLRWQFDR
jgi:glyoxylase-like metal-dependent hydrolase (beta-lactamase superfamily II)